MSDVERLVDELDFYDPAFIDDPYPTLGRLREATPIFHNPRTGQWMLTRFDDVYETLRDRRLGRVYDHLYSHEELGQPGPDPRWASFNQHEKWSLLSLEPPDHTRIRRLVSKVFTPRSVTALEPRIAELSRELVEQCREMGTFDLLSDYAQLFSVAVVGEVLGVPRRDTHLLLDWSHAIVKMYEFTVPEELKVRAETAAGEFIDYTKALITDKRRSPDGTLVSKLVETSDAGDRLSNDEIVSTTMVLLEAGHEATVNTLGNGTRALLQNRDQWRRMVGGDVDAATATEELLRYDSPLQFFNRWVLEAGVEIAGRPMAVGDDVVMLFGSAQRDPRRFDLPDRLDVGRGDPTHIGFGGGIHFCVGAPLARAELAVAFADLVRYFPDMELAEEPTRHQAFAIRGLTELRLSVN
ncbi:MAG: cytochrome P450 [Acidimicrobiia bacterium]|nr:cytochrome P450 [Acidimicrobiia bacterium]MYC46680.1 cytochrome P450 [Acidimicrobiia bacterium]MYI20582.1 cytochrome P450 [Acidimicrobiia bacterium]